LKISFVLSNQIVSFREQYFYKRYAVKIWLQSTEQGAMRRNTIKECADIPACCHSQNVRDGDFFIHLTGHWPLVFPPTPLKMKTFFPIENIMLLSIRYIFSQFKAGGLQNIVVYWHSK